MKYIVSIFCFAITAVITLTAIRCDSSERADLARIPALLNSVRLSGPLDFCGEVVELDNPEVRERLEKELLLTLWDRPQIILWIKRANRFFPIIEKMLQEHNMPQDLKYIAVIESALRPHAGSNKGAIGFWQFLKATGRKYGLVINSRKDERRNIFRSTQAAISYYKELYELFESWTLSAAAYNMGEQGLESEILAQKTDNYYQLYLPLETQRYVMKAVSAKIIFSAPQDYGFNFSEADLYPPLEYDRISLECSQETPLAIIAEAAGTYFKMIKDLNPDIRGHYLPTGSHSMLIPRGAADGFHARFKLQVDQWLVENRGRVYIVKNGDNLSAIAERFDVPLPALLIWNRLALNKPIYPGDRLVIYSERNKSKDQQLRE
ncbi:Membrane-bound lytic murein transglycosylase D [Olavius algarvensis Delta 1 endosymbiont]|nr:Membrane-bound lytic murein transglycosylase D [Olavius algarvensis Delta 1 endosymbiont]